MASKAASASSTATATPSCTYSGYRSVADLLCCTDQYRNLTPLGLQDEDVELRHHDRYAGDS
jgi:hypothetical protein